MMCNDLGTIYVVSHKHCHIPNRDAYKGIAVGSLSKKPPKGFISDQVGDNISHKNPSYCELTAIYWIWKNDVRSDIIGIEHYSRLFTQVDNRTKIIKTEDISQLLQKYDLLLPEKRSWNRSVAENYYKGGMGKEKDLDITKQVIAKLEPEYLSAFQKVMNGKSAFYCNMFILKRPLFNSYCQWLFPILEEIEKKIDVTDYTTAEKRVIGYLSELLLNVWVVKNAYSYYELPIMKPKRRIKDKICTVLSKL